MSGHTPGPWFVHATDNTCVVDGDGNDILVSPGDYSEVEVWPSMEANARLAAAAPDMLDLLKEFVGEARSNIRWMHKMLAVIAKADGDA